MACQYNCNEKGNYFEESKEKNAMKRFCKYNSIGKSGLSIKFC